MEGYVNRNLSCMAQKVYVSGQVNTRNYFRGIDNFEELQRFSQALDSASEGWRAWVASCGGDVITLGGENFKVRIGADRLTEVSELQERYGKLIGFPVVIGIGAKLSEADKALEVALISNSDINVYTPDTEQRLAEHHKLEKAQAAFHDPRDGKVYPTGSIHDLDGLPEHLQDDAINGVVESGFIDDNGVFFPKKKRQEVASIQKAEGPSSPEQHSIGINELHDTLSAAASAQGQKDASAASEQATGEQKNQNIEAIKHKVKSVLDAFKSRAKDLEQLQQQDPELYTSLVNMVQAMVAMAREFLPTPTIQKAEYLFDFKHLVKSDNWTGMGMVDPSGVFHSTDGLSHPDWAHNNRSLVGFEGTRNIDYQPESSQEDAVFDDEERTALDHFLDAGWMRIKPGAGVQVSGLYPHNIKHVHKALKQMAQRVPGRTLYVDHGDGSISVPVSPTGKPNLSVLTRHVRKSEKIELDPNVSPPPGNSLSKEDKMPGGKGDNAPDENFDAKALALGVKTEMEEHGLDAERAKEIAKDHLTEDPGYYALEKVFADYEWTAHQEDAYPRELRGFKAEQYKGTHEIAPNVWLHHYAAPFGNKYDSYLLSTDGPKPLHEQYRPMAGYFSAVTDSDGTHIDTSVIRPDHQRKGIGTAVYRYLIDKYGKLQSGGSQSPKAQKFWEHLSKQPDLQVQMGTMGDYSRHTVVRKGWDVGATGRHEVKYPVGSQKDTGPQGNRDGGKVKIQTPDGKTKWRSARAGLISAPDGTPTSSRHPNPK